MASIDNAFVSKHTTASSPRPHVLYTITVTTKDGKSYDVQRRYSEFLTIQKLLETPFSLPPKRILVTTFIPSAWLDDALISERKSGLSSYLQEVLQAESFQSHPQLVNFLQTSSASSTERFNPEDAVPSTLSRKAAAALTRQGVSTAATYIAAAYYPDWSFDANPPESLDYSKFDILFFAFATPNSSSSISWDDGSQSQLKRLVSSAKSSGHGTKVVLSIGGWGGSYWFSGTMSTSAKRTTFVNACVSAVNTYGLDGIDIDWEYPNNEGAGNPYSASDAANLLSFFKSLRTALGTSKIISAAVTDQPWIGSNGSPLTNVSSYAAQLTYVNLMNYDVWGASSSPGPNAPLSNACGNSSQPEASAQAALTQWTAAKFPAAQLLLGLPLYGYVSNSTATTLQAIALPPPNFPTSTNKQRALQSAGVDVEDSSVVGTGSPVPGDHAREKGKKVFAEASGDLSSYFGQQIAFSDLISAGALVKSSNGTYTASSANGYTQAWDDCSDTPFIYDQSRSTVVTYDDTYSIADKAAFAKSSGMGGCFTWSLDQDDGVALQNVIRSSLGK